PPGRPHRARPAGRAGPRRTAGPDRRSRPGEGGLMPRRFGGVPRYQGLLALAGGGLRARRLRSILSAAGIALGIAAMVAVLGISASSRTNLLAELDALGTNLLTVEAGQTLIGGDAKLPETAPGMISLIGPVQATAATARVSTTVRRTDHIPEAETGGIAVRAAQPGLASTLRATLSAGRFLDAATDRYPAVVLGSVAAGRLGVDRVGGRVWLGDRW